MPSFNLKIRKVKSYNMQQKKHGYITRAIINGTESFDSVAEEAARNTTINKYEMAAALGIAAEQFARALKNGFAVDLGPLGKIYPAVTGKWTETAEEQTKSLLTKVVRYDASAEIKEAIGAARLSWERLDDEKDDTTTPAEPEDNDEGNEGDENTNPGGGDNTGGSGSDNTGGTGGSGSNGGSGSGSNGGSTGGGNTPPSGGNTGEDQPF